MIKRVWKWFRYRTNIGDATFGRYAEWKWMREKKKETDCIVAKIEKRAKELNLVSDFDATWED